MAVADQILDLNLGSVMTDGQRFTNAAYIEPGWVLALPTGVKSPAADVGAASEAAAVHVVERGETLWTIARDELGAPTRWPEIWEHNRGADMGDGSQLVDPDLIMPGWELDLPMSGAPVAVAPVTAPPSYTPLAPPPDVGASRRRGCRHDRRRPAGTSRASTDLAGADGTDADIVRWVRDRDRVTTPRRVDPSASRR